MKFKTKSFIFVSTILVIATLYVSMAGVTVTESLVRELFIDYLSERSQTTADSLERIIFERASDIKVLSINPVIQDWEKNPKAARELLINVRNTYQAFGLLSIVDRNHIVRISTSNLGIGDVFVSPDVLVSAANTNNVAGVCLKSESTKKIRMIFAIPIGKAGFVIGSFPFLRLREKFYDFELPIAGYIYPHYELRDSKAKLLYNSYIDKPLSEAPLSKSDHQHKSMGEVLVSKDLLIVKNSVALNSILKNESWVLTATISWEEIFTPLRESLYGILFFIIIMVAVLSIVIQRLVTTSLRPLDHLSNALSKINDGVFEEIKEDLGRKDEFGNVIHGFNKMAKNLSKSIEEKNSATKFAALGAMSAGIAHEINNPLTIIAGYAALIEKAWNNHDEKKLYESLEKIQKTVDRIANIIKSLKTYANDDDAPLAPEHVETLLTDAIGLYQKKFKNHGIKTEVNIEPPDMMINCTSLKINQILINLLNNAFDAVFEIENEKWIHVKAIIVQERVHIMITNSGLKITEEVAQKLFTPFFTTKVVGKGTGLGLSISKAMAKSLEGKIFVDMSAQHTCFVLDLPIYKPRSTAQTARAV